MLRVSNMMMANNMCKYIQNNLQRSAKSQEQISTDKTILRPSDNPSEISHLMTVNATLKNNDQYLDNIKDGLSYLDQSDTALGTLGGYLQDAKSLATQAANDGTLSDSDRQAIEVQIDKMIDAVKDIANSSLGGKYIFAGTKNAEPPFERVVVKDPTSGEVTSDNIYFNGNTGRVQREIIYGFSYPVDAAGVSEQGKPFDAVFGTLTNETDANGTKIDLSTPADDAAVGPFQALYALKDALTNNDTDGIEKSLGLLERAHDHVLEQRVAVGARTDHLEAVQDQLNDQEVALESVVSNIQDADIAKLTIQVAQDQLVQQASLMTASNLLNTSLLQYLK